MRKFLPRALRRQQQTLRLMTNFVFYLTTVLI